MKEILDRLISVLQAKKARDPELEIFRGAPCSATEINSLEQRVGCKLPKTYRQFLEFANGIKLHDSHESLFFDLFSATILPLPVDDNQKETLAEDEINLANILIIGHVPMHNLYVFLDKSTDETVKWLDFDSVRYSSFDEFLRAEIEGLEQS
jgi:hypothetical protein